MHPFVLMERIECYLVIIGGIMITVQNPNEIFFILLHFEPKLVLPIAIIISIQPLENEDTMHYEEEWCNLDSYHV